MPRDVLVDRRGVEAELAMENYLPPFFSVLLPELGRPHYLNACLDSILEYADMPVEIIVHDDGSGLENQRQIFNQMRDKTSTLIFNTCRNLGLGSSMNRCRKMSNSPYLLAMNTDQKITSSFLRNMKVALDLPYVGIVNVTPQINPGTGVYVAPDGTKVALHRGIGVTLLFGIRRNVWDEVGGWNEYVQTTASDGGFVGSVFGRGYLAVDVEGTFINEMWGQTQDGKRNTGDRNEKYDSSARFADGDNNIPKIFGIPSARHLDACNKRRERIWHEVNDRVAEDMFYASWFNSHFATNQVASSFNSDGSIKWDYVVRFGHDKWKDRIIKDFNL